MKEIRITVNGKLYELSVRPWATLLEVIREHLGFTGTKKVAALVSVAPAPLL